MTTTPGKDLEPPPATVRPVRHPDPQALLREVDDFAQQRLAEAQNHNTGRNYAGDWRVWCQFAEDLGVDPDTVRESLFLTFVVWLQETRNSAPATIDRRLAGATMTLRARHGILAVPKGITLQARIELKAHRIRLKKQGGSLGRGEAPAMTIEHLRTICEAQPDDLPGLRTKALLLVQFGMAGRRSEPGSLLVTDIDDSDDAYLDVNLRYSKGSVDGRLVAINAGTHPSTCAVTAWRRWKHTAGITDGPAFRSVDRHENVGTKHLSGWAINEIIIAATAAAGIEEHYTGHSLRAGLITEAWLAGHDDRTISDQSGHVPGSTQLHRYKRLANRRLRGATNDLGL